MKFNPLNYVRYLLEFVIIITGVVLSFYLDDLRQLGEKESYKDTLIEELIATALDGSEIFALIAVLLEFTLNEVFPVSASSDVESLDNALFISPIAEMAVFRSSIFD